MKTLTGFRIESFIHPERGVVVAAVAAGTATDRTGKPPASAAFLVVSPQGVPSVLGPVLLPASSLDRQLPVGMVFDLALGNQTTALPWTSTHLSDGLAYFGFNTRGADTAAAACARSAEAKSNGSVNRRDAERAIHEVLDATLAPAIAAIDKGALRALRAAPSFSKSDFMFYAGGDAAKDQRRKMRLQAADAYPILAGAMARNLRAKLAVDGGKPLNEELAAAFGTHRDGRPMFSKATLKRFHALEWKVPAGITPEWLAEKIGQLPPDWFPKSPEEWDAFVSVARGLGRTLPQTLGVTFTDLVAGSGGKWADFRKRLAKSYFDSRPPENLDEEGRIAFLRNPPVPDESLEALQNAVVDLEDMVDHFSKLVVLPAAALVSGDSKPFLGETQRSAARHAASKLLLGSKNAAAMFEVSRHYHTQAERVLEEAVGRELPKPGVYKSVAEDGWAPLCNQMQAPNGVWIVPLTDPRELLDEGRSGVNQDGTKGLNHCVGGYSSACKDSGHHIISFRQIGEDGLHKRLSTLELLPVQEGETEFRERQHKGPGNGKVPAEAAEAWEWLKASVAGNTVAINYAGIRTYMSVKKMSRHDDVERACNYPWKEEGNFPRALKAYDEWLGKGLRGLGAERFLDLPEISAVAHEISPKRIATMAV